MDASQGYFSPVLKCFILLLTFFYTHAYFTFVYMLKCVHTYMFNYVYISNWGLVYFFLCCYWFIIPVLSFACLALNLPMSVSQRLYLVGWVELFSNKNIYWWPWSNNWQHDLCSYD